MIDCLYEECDFDQLFTILEGDHTFEIGQCYEDEPAKMIMCKTCGNTNFQVAVGSYFTAVRCSICKYQICVHNG